MCPEGGREWGSSGFSSGTHLGTAGLMETGQDQSGEESEREQCGNGNQQRPKELRLGWPVPEAEMRERACHSAPPAALCSPDHSRSRRRQAQAKRSMKREQAQNLQSDEHQHAQTVQQQTLPLQPPLTNFIPQQPHPQPPPAVVQHASNTAEPPSLAAQLAVGLLTAAPFHHGMPIGVAYPPPQLASSSNPPLHPQAQLAPRTQLLQQPSQHNHQLLFTPLDTAHPSAFAPPPALASALKLLETAAAVGLATTPNGAGTIIGAAGNSGVFSTSGEQFEFKNRFFRFLDILSYRIKFDHNF